MAFKLTIKTCCKSLQAVKILTHSTLSGKNCVQLIALKSWTVTLANLVLRPYAPFFFKLGFTVLSAWSVSFSTLDPFFCIRKYCAEIVFKVMKGQMNTPSWF